MRRVIRRSVRQVRYPLLRLHVFPIVAGAEQGSLLLIEAEILEAAALLKGQGLKRLDRGAREAHRLRISRTVQQLALAVDHRNRTRMHDLGQAAACVFDEWYEFHSILRRFYAGNMPFSTIYLTTVSTPLSVLRLVIT